uniref:Uncharacterized protein n=1 Tax=Neogobius melanostomus TaxID=47308 RepID=A0A8C6SCN8_9GOBI
MEMFRILLVCAWSGLAPPTTPSPSTLRKDYEDAVTFPNELYNQASKAVNVNKLGDFCTVDGEDQTFVSWQEMAVDDFLNVITQQADGLRSCISSQSHKKKNKKLNLYFKRLTTHVEQMGHSAEAWEWIRKEVKLHLLRSDMLVPRKTN